MKHQEQVNTKVTKTLQWTWEQFPVEYLLQFIFLLDFIGKDGDKTFNFFSSTTASKSYSNSIYQLFIVQLLITRYWG